mgnify:CR=1 FL=1
MTYLKRTVIADAVKMLVVLDSHARDQDEWNARVRARVDEPASERQAREGGVSLITLKKEGAG